MAILVDFVLGGCSIAACARRSRVSERFVRATLTEVLPMQRHKFDPDAVAAAESRLAEETMLSDLRQRLEALEPAALQGCDICGRQSPEIRCQRCRDVFALVDDVALLEYEISRRMGWPFAHRRIGLVALLRSVLEGVDLLALSPEELAAAFDEATGTGDYSPTTRLVESVTVETEILPGRWSRQDGAQFWAPGSTITTTIRTTTELPTAPIAPERPLLASERAAHAEAVREAETQRLETQKASERRRLEAELRRVAAELEAVR